MKRSPLKRTGFKPRTYVSKRVLDLTGVPKAERARIVWVARRLGAEPVKPRKPLPRRSKDGAKRARVRRRQFGSPAFQTWAHVQPCQFGFVAIQPERHEAGTTVWCAYFPDRPHNELCHIRTRGAGHGTLDRDGQPNVFVACPLHHDWTEGRRGEEPLKLMRAFATALRAGFQAAHPGEAVE